MTEFDPENNAMDRRIYYEVTGRELNEGEFAGVGDSSDDEWHKVCAPDPIFRILRFNTDIKKDGSENENHGQDSSSLLTDNNFRRVVEAD